MKIMWTKGPQSFAKTATTISQKQNLINRFCTLVYWQKYTNTDRNAIVKFMTIKV